MCICVAWISIMTPFYSLLILPSAWLLMKIQSSGLDTIRRIEADRSTQHALLASAVQRRCSVLNAALASLSLLGASLLLVLHTISTTDLDRVLLGCSLLCALYLSHNLSHLDVRCCSPMRISSTHVFLIAGRMANIDEQKQHAAKRTRRGTAD